jgi:uncharacterized Zn-binding protein involved in type VI secretion
MGFVLTSEALITCAHGGRVQPIPHQEQVRIEGAPVLCLGDLLQAPVIGCPVVVSPASKPCAVVLAALPGSLSTSMFVNGAPLHVDSFCAATDGVPAAIVSVVFAGQELVQA